MIQREKKKEFKKLTVQEEEEDLIEIRTVEEMVPRRFHKYLKMFEKKEPKRMPTRKT